MITRIALKFGSGPNQPNLEFNATPVTVFVGPNNSGKSKILVEIERYCRSNNPSEYDILLNEIIFTPSEPAAIQAEIEALKQAPAQNEQLNPGYIILSKVGLQNNQVHRVTIHETSFINEAQNPQSRAGWYSRYLDMFTLRLDGTNRLSLLNEQEAGDLQRTSKNHLSHLFLNNNLRAEVSRIVHDAFGKYYVIDPTNVGRLRVRLSDRPPIDEREEKGWDEASIAFHGAALEITQASDGVKAFCGIVTTLLAGDPKITLIDEPEAFLHPALSAKLAKEIGRSLRNTNKRLFIATHSASFLMGCIHSGTPIDIIRLTYKNGVGTARILPQARILHLMRHPLLRSTGVLNGLFFESVVVCESDSDRAFYQEINERLLSAADPRGLANCLFINAQNKQTIWEIVKPLRELGIPAVGIVDIDVLKEGGQVFAKPLEGAFFPQILHQPMQNQRLALLNAMNATGQNMKRDGGVNILAAQDRQACNNFFNQLQEYGVFVVRGGELESWLRHLGATGHGSGWLIDIFTRMGEDPQVPGYVVPTPGDVWDFIGQIKAWAEDLAKLGIPE